MKLNGGTIHQGDTEYLVVELTNRGNLSNSHPLKQLGFQTPDYTLRFIAKSSKNIADADAEITVSLSPQSADLASGTIASSQTKNLEVCELGLELFYEVQISDDTNTFTLEGSEKSARFTVTKELIEGV